MLSKDMIERYNRDGFLKIMSVFTRADCEHFKETLLNTANDGVQQKIDEVNKGIPIQYDREKIADVPRAIDKGMLQDIAHRNTIFMNLARDSRILGCLRPLIGNNLVMYRSLSVFKPKEYSKPVGWHRDMAYWRGGDKKISVWIALDEANADNGALHFIPGSQNQEVDPSQYEKDNEVFSIVLPGRLVDKSKAILVEAGVGDVILFHSKVFHYSGANVSGKDRYSLIFSFQPSSDESHHRTGLPELVSGTRS